MIDKDLNWLIYSYSILEGDRYGFIFNLANRWLSTKSNLLKLQVQLIFENIFFLQKINWKKYSNPKSCWIFVLWDQQLSKFSKNKHANNLVEVQKKKIH